MSAKRSNLTFTPTSRYTHIPPGLLSPNNQEFSHEKNSSPLYWFPSLFVLATFVLWLTPATSSTTPGTIYEWGAFAGKAMGGFGPGAINYEYRLVPTAWEGDDWSQLSLAGGTALHAMAIRSDGSLWGLGSNAIGQIGTGSAGGGVEEPSQIGNDHNWKEAEVDNAGSWLLKKDGTLWVTGWILTEDNVREFLYEPIRFGNDSDWTKILAARGGVPHVLAIKADGSLWAWGDNTSGQLGIGVEGGSYAIPQRVGSANDWQSIAAGNAFSLAIKSDGTLWAWGHWGLGSLGIGSDPQTTPINQPIRVGENFNWVSVSAGAAHSLAIKADGTLWAWGDNRQGQTGTGSAEGLLFSPVQVGIESDWAAVSASPTNHSLAIKTNGSLWAWGENRRGELGIGYMGYETYSTPTRVGEENHWVAVATGHFRSAAIAVHSEAEEEVASWQKPDFFLAAITLDPQPVETGATFSATVTVRNDGHVAADAGMLRLWLAQSGWVAEGTAGDYELAAGTIAAGQTVEYTFPGLTAPATAGTYHVRAMIDGDGQTAEHSTGNNQLPRAYTVFAATTGGTEEVSAGGDLWGWGLNPARAILPELASLGPIWSPVAVAPDKEWRMVRAGGSHITAICSEGKLWGWGFNRDGQAGIGATTPMNISSPQEIGGGEKWSTIATGSDNHSLAIRNDGTLWAWGKNTDGQIGVGLASESVPAPQQIGTDNDWLQVAGGHYHSVALKQDGTIWTWGRGSQGALGHDGLEDEWVPKKVGESNEWIYVDASMVRSVAIKADGSMWIWGAGVSGLPSQVNQPTRFGTDSDWKMVAPGFWHTLALKQDGTLWVWGLNRYGEFGNGTQSSAQTQIPARVGTRNDWRSVAASGHVSFAISADGELWAWGTGSSGRTGTDSGDNALVPTRVGEATDWVDVSAGWSFTLGIRGTLPTDNDDSNVVSWQKPDFFLAAITLAPQPVETGATFSATVTVRNDGHVAADAGMLRLWLAQSGWVAEGTAGDYELAAGTIAAGQTVEYTFPGLTAAATAGTYHVRAMIDADGQTAEYSTGNNQLPKAYTVFAAATGGNPGGGDAPGDSWQKPDFFLAAITLDPQPVETGATFSATVTVRNDGHVAGDAGMLRLWLNQSGLVAEGTAGDYELVAGTIEAGETVEYTFPGLTAPANSGTYHLRAFIDADGQTAEYSTGNNQLPRAYTLAAAPGTEIPSWMKPDFVVPSLFLTPQPSTVGARFQAVIRVTNIGDIPGDARELAVWTRSPSWHNLADTPDVIIPLGTLAVDEVLEFTIEDLQAPMAPGTFFVRAIVNPHGATAEKSLGNNQGGATYTIQPVVLRISVLPSGGNQLSWNGTPNFEYWVERSTTLPGGFSILAGPLPGTAPQTVFVDESPPAGGTVFYRVWGVQP